MSDICSRCAIRCRYIHVYVVHLRQNGVGARKGANSLVAVNVRRSTRKKNDQLSHSVILQYLAFWHYLILGKQLLAVMSTKDDLGETKYFMKFWIKGTEFK